jgi:hypothetical protein
VSRQLLARTASAADAFMSSHPFLLLAMLLCCAALAWLLLW